MIFVRNTFSTHLIPLRCMIHNTMVALTQKRMKKSTVSARNLRRGEGMVYSLPERTKDEVSTMKLEPNSNASTDIRKTRRYYVAYKLRLASTGAVTVAGAQVSLCVKAFTVSHISGNIHFIIFILFNSLYL